MSTAFYNGKVKERNNTIQQRKQGPSYPLKLFHNEIKLAMLKAFTGEIHFEFCGGSGGDIGKLALLPNPSATKVYFFEVSDESLKEAQSRWQQFQKKNRTSKEFYFLQQDLSRPIIPITAASYSSTSPVNQALPQSIQSIPQALPQAQSISCQFALSYMAKSVQVFQQFLANVSNHLCRGGYFFGIVTDGSSVSKLLQRNQFQPLKMSLLSLQFFGRSQKEEKNKEYEHFGQAFQMSIDDTIIAVEEKEEEEEKEKEGKEEEEGEKKKTGNNKNLEYFLTEEMLVSTAEKYGLQPIKKLPGTLAQYLHPESEKKCLKRIYPNYPARTDPSFIVASSLYSLFVFQKK